MPDDFLFVLFGLIAAYLGFRNLEQARNRLKPMAFFTALLGWWGLVRFFPGLAAIDGERGLVALAFLFLGLSPIIGFVLYWEEGKIIKILFKLILFFLVLVGVAALARHEFQFDLRVSLAMGFLGGLIATLPYRKLARLLLIRSRSRAQEKERRRQQEVERLEGLKAEANVQQYRNFLEHAIQELRH